MFALTGPNSPCIVHAYKDFRTDKYNGGTSIYSTNCITSLHQTMTPITVVRDGRERPDQIMYIEY